MTVGSKNSAAGELREAARRLRDTPRCAEEHDGCDCGWSDLLIIWLEQVAQSVTAALDTARAINRVTEPDPKPFVDYLPEWHGHKGEGASGGTRVCYDATCDKAGEW